MGLRIRISQRTRTNKLKHAHSKVVLLHEVGMGRVSQPVLVHDLGCFTVVSRQRLSTQHAGYQKLPKLEKRSSEVRGREDLVLMSTARNPDGILHHVPDL